MAQTTVSDFVMWAKHIHGDASIVDRILGLEAGELLSLSVDGSPGTWPTSSQSERTGYDSSTAGCGNSSISTQMPTCGVRSGRCGGS